MMEHGVPQYLDAELLEKFAEVKREQLDRNADYKLPNYQQYEQVWILFREVFFPLFQQLGLEDDTFVIDLIRKRGQVTAMHRRQVVHGLYYERNKGDYDQSLSDFRRADSDLAQSNRALFEAFGPQIYQLEHDVAKARVEKDFYIGRLEQINANWNSFEEKYVES